MSRKPKAGDSDRGVGLLLGSQLPKVTLAVHEFKITQRAEAVSETVARGFSPANHSKPTLQIKNVKKLEDRGLTS